MGRIPARSCGDPRTGIGREPSRAALARVRRGGRGAGARRPCLPRSQDIAICFLLVTPLACAGCQEERIVAYHHPFEGLPNVTGGLATGPVRVNAMDPRIVPEDRLFIEHEDGSRTLIMRSGRHLMVHIYNALADDDADIFAEQILSSLTRAEYVERGLDPRQALADLRARQRDMLALFNLMPEGENSAGAMWTRLGRAGPDNLPVVRLSISGPQTRDLGWNFMDMVMEKGNWRLRWFGRE